MDTEVLKVQVDPDEYLQGEVVPDGGWVEPAIASSLTLAEPVVEEELDESILDPDAYMYGGRK